MGNIRYGILQKLSRFSLIFCVRIQNGSQSIHFMKQPVHFSFLITCNPRLPIAGDIFCNLHYRIFHDFILFPEISIADHQEYHAHDQSEQQNIKCCIANFKNRKAAENRVKANIQIKILQNKDLIFYLQILSLALQSP